MLVALTASLFLPATRGQFVCYDDDQYVTQNERVQQGLTLDNVRWSLSAVVAANWHPVTLWSHMLDCQWFGLDPRGHYLTSIVLHALSAGLLLAALWQMTGRYWPSLLVAAIYAWHPLRVESVAWVAERKDVLSAVFCWLTLAAYARYAQRWRCYWYALATLALALGLASKPMLVTVPCLLLVLDWWPLQRASARGWATWRALVIEKLPLAALSAAAIATTLWAQGRTGAIHALDERSMAARLAAAIDAYGMYLWQTVWPWDLAVIYPLVPPPAWRVALFALLLLAITALAVAERHRRPHLLTGWLWYLGLLVPVLGLVQVGHQVRADRFTYLPQVGLWLALSWTLAELAERGVAWRRAVVVGCLVALAALMSLTVRQIGFWRDSETLFRRALAVTGGNYVAHHNLGFALDEQRRTAEAIEHYRAAVALRPDYVEARRSLAGALLEQGEWEAARREAEAAVAQAPDYAPARLALGAVLDRLGRLDEARQQFARAVELRPGDSQAWYALASILYRTGQLEAAQEAFERLLELEPHRAGAYDGLGAVLAARGQLDAAAAMFDRAMALRPDDAALRASAAQVAEARGDPAAIEHYRAALRLAPDDAHIALRLAWLLATHPRADLRDAAEATALARRVVATPATPGAVELDVLAAAYAADGQYERAAETASAALARAEETGATHLVDAIRQRLALYRAGRPFRQAAP